MDSWPGFVLEKVEILEQATDRAIPTYTKMASRIRSIAARHKIRFEEPSR